MSANDRRAEALRNFGFTERQARFLVLVMRLAGVCVPRWYLNITDEELRKAMTGGWERRRELKGGGQIQLSPPQPRECP
ncbi:MAG TPA: hypothetical protein VM364_09325 [Vicinamibacterales bacterium]|nr:hypothetical protein [Vicinamibacterales bacterium]